MGFIDLPGVDDVREPQIAPEGRYSLIVESAQVRKNENSGKTNVLVALGFDGEPDFANILHNLALPHEDDTSEGRKFKLLQIKRFGHQFGITVDGGINTEEFSGSTAECNVKIDEYQGQKKNILQLDPLPSED